MNIFKREMKANRKSLIIWCLSSIFLIVAGMSKYTALSADTATLKEMLVLFPKPVLVIFGMSNLDMSTAMGYYGIVFFYVLLMCSIHICLLSTTIITKEINENTGDFLYVKPISSRDIVIYKLLASFVNALLLNLISFLSSLLILIPAFKDIDIFLLCIMYLGLLILQLFFLSLGSLFTVIIKNSKKVSTYASLIVLIFYLFYIVSDLSDALTFTKYFTPFKYFDANYILSYASLNIIYCFILIVVSSLAIWYTLTQELTQ